MKAVASLALALSLTATAAEVYRCGNMFSQTPCPGGEKVTVKAGGAPPTAAPADGLRESEKALSEQMEKERKALDRERCLQEMARAETALAEIRSDRQRFLERQAAWSAQGGHGSKGLTNDEIAKSQALANDEINTLARINRLRAKPDCREK